ncbi:MAG: helix-turn-helix domain-containing protein [Cyclobacteriaceae bacterium]
MQDLSKEAVLALKYVNNTNATIFLTGKAGTGKTTLLKYIIEHTYKNTLIAAPTGIAAINAGGVTLHSLLQLPFGTYVPDEYFQISDGQQINTPKSVFQSLKMGQRKREMLREMDLLIIDEVSMLRADLLDCMDLILRRVRKNRNLPFGGVQILFIGDLLQLPPVVKQYEWQTLQQYYGGIYFFDAQVMRQSPPVYIELKHIYRQTDQKFIDLLNNLRSNSPGDEDIALLNQYYDPSFDPKKHKGYIHLTTHNRKADKINEEELRQINAQPIAFDAHVKEEFPDYMYPAPSTLTLKEGAQVMFTKNDPSGEQRFFNGKIGKVTQVEPGKITVEDDDGNQIDVEAYTWENIRYTLDEESGEIAEKVIGTFEQFPLRLAWAITVHKSQGLTFNQAILDLTDSFAPGQMYVALSRLTSLDGLVLSSPIPSTGFNADVRIAEFSTNSQDMNKLENGLDSHTRQFLALYCSRAFDFTNLCLHLDEHLKSFNKSERSPRQKHAQWTQDLKAQTDQLRSVADRFIHQVVDITRQANYTDQLIERMSKAKHYFWNEIASIQQAIDAHRNDVNAKKKIKGYNKELKTLEHLYYHQRLAISKANQLIEAIANNNMLSKDDIKMSKDFLEVRNLKQSKTEQSSKTNTKDITLEMFQAGKTVDDIAIDRGMVRGTIMGHLIHFVQEGKLKADEIVNQEILDNILTVANTIKSNSLNEIKSKLGDEYGYDEIKLALVTKTK